MSIYSLKLYDDELLRFSLKKRGLEGFAVSIIDVDEEKWDLAPLDLELTDESVLKWLEYRVIPKSRAFVDRILTSLGLATNDTKGIIDICKGLSLNDSYWVVPFGFGGKFSEYNLYENRFSEALALIAYTGAGGSRPAFSTSPELTTNGMLPKAWRFIDDEGVCLYKGGTEGAVNTGNEPYNEFYACQIARTIGLNAVQYDLENWKGILASKCKLFTDINTSYIPIGRIVKTGKISECLNFYSKLGNDFLEELKSMLVFDAVIYNEDRHLGNFGVLRDNHTGRIVAPAPIFDNGFSLFNFAMPYDFDNIGEYAKTRVPPYPTVTFEEICREVMGPTQKAQLRKLINFKFERHSLINFPEKRLQAIEKQINVRVGELLEIPIAHSNPTHEDPER